MKENTSETAVWTVEADRRFARSPLGQRLLGLLAEGSSSQRRLAEFVLRNPVVVATRGIEELARVTGISTATISRFVREAGHERYADFRSAVADAVRDLVAPVAKLSGRFGGATSEMQAAASLAAARAELAALGDPATMRAIGAVSRRIKAANHVYTMGFGLSAHLAAMLALGLQPYRDQVINTVQFGGTEVAAGRIMTIGPTDMLIAISFPRYAGDLLTLVRFARDNGARIVAITDSTAAPLARYADDLLVAPAQHPILSSSQVAGLAIIEALVAEFMVSDPAHLERAERLTKSIAAYLVGD